MIDITLSPFRKRTLYPVELLGLAYLATVDLGLLFTSIYFFLPRVTSILGGKLGEVTFSVKSRIQISFLIITHITYQFNHHEGAQ